MSYEFEPDFLAIMGAAKATHSLVELGPLDTDGVRRIVELHLGVRSVPSPAVEFIATRANGSSRLTKQLTDALVNEGALECCVNGTCPRATLANASDGAEAAAAAMKVLHGAFRVTSPAVLKGDTLVPHAIMGELLQM